MRHLIMIFLLCFSLTGCSLLPRITFDKAGVTPQTTQKSDRNVRCAGEYRLNEEGDVIYCSKGYYVNERNYKQDERKYTLQERIANFIRGLAGWGFWIFIALLILCPTVLGSVLGWILNGIFGGTRKMLEQTRATLVSTIRGIQKAKKNGVNLPPEERAQYQAHMTEILNIISDEHKDNPNIVKMIDDIRTELKIKEKL